MTTEQILQKFPGGKVIDKIDHRGQHRLFYSDADGIVHPVATRVNRDSTARANLSRKYQQRFGLNEFI